MKRTTKTRLISLLMVLAMLVSYIPATVWAVDATTDIKAIQKPTGWIIVEDYDDYFGDAWLEKLGLPETVQVTLADNTIVVAPVEWDISVLDTRTAGYYSVPGTVTLPEGATNSQNLGVTITIQVAQKKNLFLNGDFETKGTNTPAGWNIPGSGVRYTTEFTRSGNVAGWARGTNVTDVKRNGYNQSGDESPENVAARVSALGAGQYYFGIYARKGDNAVEQTFQAQFFYRVNGETSTPATQKPTGQKITLTTQYQPSCGIVEMPENVTFVQMQYTFYKTDKTVTFDEIGSYLDDAELIALKTVLKVEPSAIESVKTEILSRKVALNYPDYVGENWKDALGLPSSVEVVTDNGSVANVDVTWSFAGLDFSQYGKYTLVGTLDDSGFPNPKGLTVEQTIYVTKATNLLPNASFETGLDGWYLRGMNPNPITVQSPVKDGKYAAMSGILSTTGKSMSFLDTRHQDSTLFVDVDAYGGGQFYFGAWTQYSEKLPEGMQTQMNVLYKVYQDDGTLPSSSTTIRSDASLMIDGQYNKTEGLVNIPANVGYVHLIMYIFSQNDGEIAAPIYVDGVELIPINVEIPKGQEPEDVAEVISEIPVRAVVENYDSYVGENWQDALGLPQNIEVRTSNDNIASVGVTWNFDTLNLKSQGKYILVGTLDNSLYPNPNNLFVTQVIYIVEYKNLLSNPSFESGLNSWYFRGLNPSPSTVSVPVKAGTSAAATGHWTVSGKETSYGDTRDMNDALLAAVDYSGAGQYYISIWAQYSGEVKQGMQHRIHLLYKQYDADGNLPSSSTTIRTDRSDFVADEYTQASRVFNLPGNLGFVQWILYASSANDGELGLSIYADHAEMVPLNVIVEQYEGEMVQVESIIPDRQIIQNFPDYIGAGYTVKDLMLPETVNVRSSTGELVKVPVKWNYDKLDLTKTGTYTVYGSLTDMQIPNPNGLTVQQKIRVVSAQNLFSNPSFEQDTSGWDKHSNLKVTAGITSPVKSGGFSLKLETTRMDNWSNNYLQAFYNSGHTSVGQKITKTGGGLYYYGGWLQGTESSNDLNVYFRFYYRCLSTGDSLYSSNSSTVSLPTDKFVQVGNVVELPDDIYMAHLDLFMLGAPEQLRLSTMYIDDMALIPLNVEVANLTDIIDMEETAVVYVHKGTSFEGLKLPKTLQVTIKTGQKFNLGITWNTRAYDPNKIGEQIITGSLNLGTTYKNSKNFVPTVKVVVRAKGEELRETIYFSTSGDDANDGLSPEKPKYNIKEIGTYLAQGYNVRLKRGDIWYLPGVNMSIKNVLGTEDAPLTLGAYGSGEMPIIAFMYKIENTTWKLVDEKRNVWAADLSTLPTNKGITVHRCFGDDVTYFHKLRNNYISLDEGEYCSYDKTLYLRMPEGQRPENIKITPFGYGGHNLMLQNISYMNVENIHIMGGNPTVSMMFIDAPTKHLRFTYCSITHGYNYQMMWETDDSNIHYKPEISYCYINPMLSEKEGWFAEEGTTAALWNVSSIEGITLRDGVESAWIHHNYMENLSHAFIAIESTGKKTEYDTTGVRNCLIEDNVLEGGYAMYARAFNICGGFNQSGVQMCHDNTYRRNRAYDMTSSSHLFGENNLIYSNLFSYHHMTYNEDGTLFEGKGPMPGAFDTIIYNDHTSVGNMLVNNTFYNCGSAICINDSSHTVYNNIYANNLIVNWSYDVPTYPGGFYDYSVDFNYIMNNGMYSQQGYVDQFCVDKVIYMAADVNNIKSGYSGNISADPMFLTADINNLDKYTRMDFTLSNQSPMRYAGLSLYSSTYRIFPAWERLMAEYTDINGVAYLAESPSIGAWSFCELITGDVAEVGSLTDILARPGATIDQLNLPDSVPAVNDQGIDVILLIDWDTAQFDGNKPGTVTLTGALRNGPHTDLNVEGKTASININIKDRLELVDIITVLKNVTLLYGTSFEDAVKALPSTLSVVEESGYEEELPVTWSCEDYDPTKPAAYTFKCVLPDDMVTNARDFSIEVGVRLLHEISRGSELLVNPDFIDGTSAAPWKIGWGTGSFKITTDPQYLMDGEPGAAIVTMSGKYGSIQQDVVGQMQLMGDGKYLFKVYMRAFEEGKPIDSSYACLKVWGPKTTVYTCRAASDIGTGWVEFSAVMDVTDLAQATEVSFHTSTGKSDDDIASPAKSYIIAGCSLIYLGKTEAEVDATMDSIGLVWNAIKGQNKSESDVMTDLNLPAKIGSGSTIKWSSSDESVITNDGKVTMGRVAKSVKLTATITYNGIETVKVFDVTVPRNPELPTFTGSLTGSQDVNIGDEFKVTISLSSDKATSFNAYRFTLSFNTSKVAYVGISDPTAQVEVEGGRVTIFGIGTERPITDTITVTFKALKSGITEVKLVKMEMDNDPNVTLDTLPTMTVTDGVAVIDVQKEETANGATTETTEKDNNSVIWIVIGLVAAALIAGGAIVFILIKKKKQTPPATEE